MGVTLKSGREEDGELIAAVSISVKTRPQLSVELDFNADTRLYEDLMSESGLLPEVTHGADGVKPNYIEGHFCK